MTTNGDIERWMRFVHEGRPGFGLVHADTILLHEGDLFGDHRATNASVPVTAVTPLPPSQASKMIGLWNNFRALGAKLELATPDEPLYFLKSPSSFAPDGAPIRQPLAYDGRVVFEAELGIVIGTRASGVDEREAGACIFGYTCVNDVTAFDVLNRDPSFPQWARAKSYDGFGIFGPVVARGVAPETLIVRALLDGEERQNYPVSDMIFSPAKLVALLSRDMTLLPGDIIACGTSVGAGRMKPGQVIQIAIDGIGTLTNRFAGSE